MIDTQPLTHEQLIRKRDLLLRKKELLSKKSSLSQPVEPEQTESGWMDKFGRRASAGVRESIRSIGTGKDMVEEYAKGFESPETSESFQQQAIRMAQEDMSRRSPVGKLPEWLQVPILAAGAIPASGAGLAADIATNPLETAAMSLPMVKPVQKAVGGAAKLLTKAPIIGKPIAKAGQTVTTALTYPLEELAPKSTTRTVSALKKTGQQIYKKTGELLGMTGERVNLKPSLERGRVAPVIKETAEVIKKAKTPTDVKFQLQEKLTELEKQKEPLFNSPANQDKFIGPSVVDEYEQEAIRLYQQGKLTEAQMRAVGRKATQERQAMELAGGRYDLRRASQQKSLRQGEAEPSYKGAITPRTAADQTASRMLATKLRKSLEKIEPRFAPINSVEEGLIPAKSKFVGMEERDLLSQSETPEQIAFAAGRPSVRRSGEALIREVPRILERFRLGRLTGSIENLTKRQKQLLDILQKRTAIPESLLSTNRAKDLNDAISRAKSSGGIAGLLPPPTSKPTIPTSAQKLLPAPERGFEQVPRGESIRRIKARTLEAPTGVIEQPDILPATPIPPLRKEQFSRMLREPDMPIEGTPLLEAPKVTVEERIAELAKKLGIEEPIGEVRSSQKAFTSPESDKRVREALRAFFIRMKGKK